MTQTARPNNDAPSPDLERQRPLNLNIPHSVAIVGVGGVGSWIAMFLALAGVPELHLWDHDEVSETNLNRLPLGPEYINSNKAMAMRHMLGTLKPSCQVVPMAARWEPSEASSLGMPEWIVACTDTWRSRRMIYSWAKNEDHRPINDMDIRQPRAKYIEASAEGEFGGCTGEPAMFASRLEHEPGYASVPVWVGPCVASAYMVCAHILHNNHHMGSLGLRLGYSNPNGRPGLQQWIDLQASQ